ncbi:MAG: hypothetical protein GYA17_00295 [Chloroflexi bacterium]|nr:hypothetical protein [Chloroflexota bacterium]
MNLMNNTIGISNLIELVKKDLIDESHRSPQKLFTIDEITLEISFVVQGNINSGFNLGVVTLGSEVKEERIHKVVVKMTPIVDKQQLTKSYVDPNLINDSQDSIIRGEP